MSSVKSQESRLEGLGIVSRSLFYGAKIIKNIQTAKFYIKNMLPSKTPHPMKGEVIGF